MRKRSVQEVVASERVEIGVDTRIKTDIEVQNNGPGLFVLDKRNNEITIIEVGITSQD
jgi:protein tyrosine/serine phosphatase